MPGLAGSEHRTFDGLLRLPSLKEDVAHWELPF
jgi:hypothetical protein